MFKFAYFSEVAPTDVMRRMAADRGVQLIQMLPPGTGVTFEQSCELFENMGDFKGVVVASVAEALRFFAAGYKVGIFEWGESMPRLWNPGRFHVMEWEGRRPKLVWNGEEQKAR